MGYYAAVKTKQTSKKTFLHSATTWMDLEKIMLSELSQSVKVSHDLTYLWNIMSRTSQEQNVSNRSLGTYNRQTAAEKGVGKGDKPKDIYALPRDRHSNVGIGIGRGEGGAGQR